MPDRRRRKDRRGEDLEPGLGRSLAETERLNSPEHRAGEQARRAVRRASAVAGRGAAGRRLVLSMLGVLAAIGLIGWLVVLAD